MALTVTGHNRMMLRLAPSQPPLWRSESSVQFGANAVARVDGVTLWQERLLDALVDGIPDAMLVPLARSLGASADEAADFVGVIRHALARAPEAGRAVIVEVPDGLARAELDVIVSALEGAELSVEVATPWSPTPARTPVIAVAHRLLDPRRAARLVAADVPHLPLELSGDLVNVGPLVIPGITACVACAHAHHRDADPSWPLVAVQLLGRAPTPTDRALLLEAAVLASRMLSGAATGPAASVTLSAQTVRRTWHAHRPHEHCQCRSPAGIAMADDHGDPATMTSTAFARPA